MRVSSPAQSRLAADLRRLREQLRAAIGHADLIAAVHVTAEQLAIAHGRLLGEIDSALRELARIEQRVAASPTRRGGST